MHIKRYFLQTLLRLQHQQLCEFVSRAGAGNEGLPGVSGIRYLPVQGYAVATELVKPVVSETQLLFLLLLW